MLVERLPVESWQAGGLKKRRLMMGMQDGSVDNVPTWGEGLEPDRGASEKTRMSGATAED